MYVALYSCFEMTSRFKHSTRT